MNRISKLVLILYLVVQCNMTLAEKVMTKNESLEYLGILAEKRHLDIDDPTLGLKKHGFLFGTKAAYFECVFNLYGTFLLWDSDRGNEKYVAQAHELFESLVKQFYTEYQKPKTEEEIEERFFLWMIDRELIEHIEQKEIIQPGGFDKNHYRLPLWLVLKHPKILQYDYGRSILGVAADMHIYDMPEFDKLTSLLEGITDDHWITTSYIPFTGTIIRDIRGGRRGLFRDISFAPALVLEDYQEQSTEDCLRPIKVWGTRGIWNKKKLTEFTTLYTDFCRALEKYYANDPDLKGYSSHAEKIASILVNYYVTDDHSSVASTLIERVDESTVKKGLTAALEKGVRVGGATFFDDAINLPEGSGPEDCGKKFWDEFIQTLLLFTPAGEDPVKFCNKSWNEFLSRAILSDYSAETIDLIIKFGADVNGPNFAERPIMNAAGRPAILSLLIDTGAKIDAPNPFGKTALFYAIQHNNYDSVKLLIEQGADVNHSLANLDKFIELAEDYEQGEIFRLEQVAEFTPLVYAMRYASKEIIELLKDKGAKMGDAPRKRINEWVGEGQ